MSWAHWKKFDHVTFLVALVLALINLAIPRVEIAVGIVVFMLLALIYDIYEQR